MADYVSKYTGSEVDGILDEAIELPQATSSDEGKFLKYDSGSVIWDSLPEGLPTHHNSTYNNSILTIDNYGNVDWYRSGVEGSDGQYLKYSENSGIIWDYLNVLPTGSNHQFLEHGSDSVFWADGELVNTYNAHNGEFLKYSNTSGVIWDNPIDTSNASNGAFLKYDSDAGTGANIVWTDPISIFPTHDSQGDFLKYSASSGIIWSDPLPQGHSNGDFLKYSTNTGLMWDNAPGIDTTNAHNGDFLKYSSTTGLTWGTAATFPEYNDNNAALLTMDSGCIDWKALEDLPIFPDYDTSDDSSDAGKILTILNNGSLGWVLPNQ